MLLVCLMVVLLPQFQRQPQAPTSSDETTRADRGTAKSPLREIPMIRPGREVQLERELPIDAETSRRDLAPTIPRADTGLSNQ